MEEAEESCLYIVRQQRPFQHLHECYACAQLRMLNSTKYSTEEGNSSIATAGQRKSGLRPSEFQPWHMYLLDEENHLL
jgi:hypothetical protein